MKGCLESMINILFIGPRNSGKTAYLTTLYAYEKSLLSLRDTAEYFFEKLDELNEGHLGETDEFVELVFRYKDSKYLTKFSTFDYSGEIVEGNLKNQEEESQKLVEAINKANGIIFLLPYLDNPKEHMGMLVKLWKDTQYILELVTNRNNYKNELPVVIALTKYDLFERFADLRKTQAENILKYFKDIQIYDKIYKSFDNFTNVELTAFSIHNQENVLVTPIKIIIHNFYHNLEQKIKRVSGDRFKLFIEIGKNYDVLKLLQNGKFIHDFEEIEYEVQKYFLNLIKKLKQDFLSSKEILKAIEKEKELFDTIRNEKIKVAIKNEIQKVERAEKRKKILWQSMSVFSVLFFIFLYSYNQKQDALTRIESLIDNNNDLLTIKKEIGNFKNTFSSFNPFYALLGVHGDVLKLENDLKIYTSMIKNQLNKSFQMILDNSYDLDKKISDLSKIQIKYKKYFPDDQELNVITEVIVFLQEELKAEKTKAKKMAFEKEYLEILRIADLNQLIDKLEAFYNRYYDSLGKSPQMQMVAKMLEIKRSQLKSYIKDHKISLKLDNFIQDFEENNSKYTIKDIDKYLQNDICQIDSVEIATKYNKKLLALKAKKFEANQIQYFLKEFEEKLNQLTLKTLWVFDNFVKNHKEIIFKISDDQLSFLQKKLFFKLNNFETQMLDSNLSLAEKKYFVQELEKFNIPLLNFYYSHNSLNEEKIQQLGMIKYLEFKIHTDKLFDCDQEKDIIISLENSIEFNGEYEINDCLSNIVTISKIPTLETNVTDFNISQ